MDKRSTNLNPFLRCYMVGDVIMRYCPKCGAHGERSYLHGNKGLMMAELAKIVGIRRASMRARVRKFRDGIRTWEQVMAPPAPEKYPGLTDECAELGISTRAVQKRMNGPDKMPRADALAIVCKNKRKQREHGRGRRSDPPDICALASSFNSLPVLVDSITEGEWG